MSSQFTTETANGTRTKSLSSIHRNVWLVKTMAKKTLTTGQGVPVADNQNSLTAGQRGPVLLQDVTLIEKLAHFNRERIPECVVHAKGAGAHGYFQVFTSMVEYTKAKFLQDPKKNTPVLQQTAVLEGLLAQTL